MPLSKVDLNDKSKRYLQPFVDNVETILKNYKENYNNFKLCHLGWEGRLPKPKIDGWSFCGISANFPSKELSKIFPEYEENNSIYFPEIMTIINSFPENVHMISSAIIEMSPGMEPEQFHNEHYNKEKGFKRYHIPLKTTDKAKMKIIEDDGEIYEYTWELRNVYEFENPENMHCVEHHGDSSEDSRIVYIINLIENDDISKEEMSKLFVATYQTETFGIIKNY